ncbi:Amylo-alpha-1,6-glucosidase [Phycisphaerae bacterium RAS1]|nr:Amylo-alpha-1,6-glucosidase [Phycisphaerae bacterium RAS1]
MNELEAREWLEADGLGGFASGTASGIRTRRYHGLLLSALRPPTERVMLVNGIEGWLRTPDGLMPLSQQRYAPGVVHPPSVAGAVHFEHEPWPTWRFRLPGGAEIEFELFVPRGLAAIVLGWRGSELGQSARLLVRPFLSGRDFHALYHENAAARLDAEIRSGRAAWQTHAALPKVVALHNGEYTHEPLWYRQFVYEEERQRGQDFVEDLATPGVFSFALGEQPATLILAAGDEAADALMRSCESAAQAAKKARARELRRRRDLGAPLQRAADAYIVSRGDGRTIIAGYPWFADWGRDTFIAVRGLCLSSGRLRDARDVLMQWTQVVSEGMLPNRFPDRGDTPDYNSVDASLWFIIAAHELIQAAEGKPRVLSKSDVRALHAAVGTILRGYSAGTRYGIRMTADGLLAAGGPGVQLTWMDVKLGDWVVTPRIGKPVEIQALWLSALHLASGNDSHWAPLVERGLDAFERRFWNDKARCLYDVVDCGHVDGAVSGEIRPNQIFAVGGLPLQILKGPRAVRVVAVVEEQLWTPLGPRSLDPDHRDYRPAYVGDAAQRDAAYHNGTVWPWLAGAFVQAWLRTRGDTSAARAEARQRFVEPLLDHLEEAGLGHVSEIADAEPPHAPRGCPFQAWSTGELIRMLSMTSES